MRDGDLHTVLTVCLGDSVSWTVRGQNSAGAGCFSIFSRTRKSALNDYKAFFPQGVRRPEHDVDRCPSCSVPKLRMSGALPLLPPYACMVWTVTTSFLN
jgi:hypothetical protein